MATAARVAGRSLVEADEDVVPQGARDWFSFGVSVF
jgi:hypothetical protein